MWKSPKMSSKFKIGRAVGFRSLPQDTFVGLGAGESSPRTMSQAALVSKLLSMFRPSNKQLKKEKVRGPHTVLVLRQDRTH